MPSYQSSCSEVRFSQLQNQSSFRVSGENQVEQAKEKKEKGEECLFNRNLRTENKIGLNLYGYRLMAEKLIFRNFFKLASIPVQTSYIQIQTFAQWNNPLPNLLTCLNLSDLF